MTYFIDKTEVASIITMIVERWAGGTLNDNQRRALDSFMEEEIKPLGSLELLNRMNTPIDVLKWFLSYIQTRMPDLVCEPMPASEDDYFCCTS